MLSILVFKIINSLISFYADVIRVSLPENTYVVKVFAWRGHEDLGPKSFSELVYTPQEKRDISSDKRNKGIQTSCLPVSRVEKSDCCQSC